MASVSVGQSGCLRIVEPVLRRRVRMPWFHALVGDPAGKDKKRGRGRALLGTRHPEDPRYVCYSVECRDVSGGPDLIHLVLTYELASQQEGAS